MSLNQNEIKKKILDKLQNNPIIGHACKNAGVARSTFYRFRETDKDFNEATKKAQRVGRAVTCDAAESKILNLINSDNEDIALKASKTILNTYNHRYQNNNLGINYQKAVLKNEIEKTEKEKKEILDSFSDILNLTINSVSGENKLNEEEKLLKLKETLDQLLEKIKGSEKNIQNDEEDNLRGFI
jgi:hypothetical protein